MHGVFKDKLSSEYWTCPWLSHKWYCKALPFLQHKLHNIQKQTNPREECDLLVFGHCLWYVILVLGVWGIAGILGHNFTEVSAHETKQVGVENRHRCQQPLITHLHGELKYIGVWVFHLNPALFEALYVLENYEHTLMALTI